MHTVKTKKVVLTQFGYLSFSYLLCFIKYSQVPVAWIFQNINKYHGRTLLWHSNFNWTGNCLCCNWKLFLVFTSRIVKSYLVSAPVSITATCITVIILCRKVFNSHCCMPCSLRFTFCLFPISSCLAVRSLTAFITSVCKCVCACDKLHYVTYLDWRGCQQFGATY